MAVLPILAVPATGAASVPHRDVPRAISAVSFTNRINNPYLPLKPGTVFTYVGRKDGLPERNVVRVTHKTKTILGIQCVVVQDTVWVAGKLAENTTDWYAQDGAGAVWYFGEASRDFKSGRLVTTQGSWQAGVDGARQGIVMLAHPRVGRSYPQEYLRGAAEDQAAVLSLRQSVSVAEGSYAVALVTKEWTPLEPGIVEHKYYAPGVGNVYTKMVSGGSDYDKLTLVRHGR